MKILKAAELRRIAVESCPLDAGVRPLLPLLLDAGQVAFMFQPWRWSVTGSVEATSPIGVVELSPQGDVLAVRPLPWTDPWRSVFPRGPRDVERRVRDGKDPVRSHEAVSRLQHVVWAAFLEGRAPDADRPQVEAFADAWWSSIPLYEVAAQRAFAGRFWQWVSSVDEPGLPTESSSARETTMSGPRKERP